MAKYLDSNGLAYFWEKVKAYVSSQSGSNTTYTLTKSGDQITLTGSDGSTNSVTDSDTTALGSMTGTLGIANGGTGQTTANAAANAFVNALGTGSTAPVDDDYMITQYVNGGTTTTTYHRRKMSVVWEYFKSKIQSAALTLTDHLTMSAKYLKLKSSNLDITSPPTGTDAVWGNSRVYFYDKNDQSYGQIAPVHWPEDSNRISRRGLVIGPGNNYLYLSSDSNNANPHVIVSGGASGTVAGEWRSAIGAAAASHEHSTDDITSGTLGYARGGTNATSAAGIRTNIHHGAATAIKTTATDTPTSNTKVALNSVNSSNTSLISSSVSSNGLKCLVAGKVIVSGGWYGNNVASGVGAVLIYQNSTKLGEFVDASGGVGVVNPVFPPRVVTVAANDVFYMYWRSTDSAKVAANQAWLTVQYVS